MRGRVINIIRAMALAGAACGALVATTPAANATTATATLTAGSLGFVSAPPNVSFTGTLTGANQTLNATQPIDVSDATGSGAGWNLTATSTTFTNGGNTLSTSATTVNSAPTVACDTGSTCSVATPSTGATAVTYPYTLPAGATAPTATKMFSAASGTGMGDQTASTQWSLAIPGNARAGTYTSTWTLSLVSGP